MLISSEWGVNFLKSRCKCDMYTWSLVVIVMDGASTIYVSNFNSF